MILTFPAEPAPRRLALPAASLARVCAWPAAPAARVVVVPVTGVVAPPPSGVDFDPADFSAEDFKTT